MNSMIFSYDPPVFSTRPVNHVVDMHAMTEYNENDFYWNYVTPTISNVLQRARTNVTVVMEYHLG